MALAEACFRLTMHFPKAEIFGMAAQIRRASSSIPANIAEGHGREQTRSFVQYLRIAQGSLKELETHLLLAHRVELIQQAEADTLVSSCETLGKMLRALIRSLQIKNQSAQ